MKKIIGLLMFVLFSLAGTGCGSQPGGFFTPDQIAPSATPIVLTRLNPADAKKPLTGACTLVTRQDVGGFFGAEVQEPLYAINQTHQVIFPAPPVSATEYYCVYLAFHRPSSIQGYHYQVTYWVDTPDKASSSEWDQTWVAGKSHALQVIPGLGEDAFFVNGRLTFKTGGTFVTVEILSNQFDTSTADGIAAQIEIEKKAALTAIGRMAN